MKRLELRNVPAKLIRGYLVSEFGGGEQPDGSVEGEGWVVRFEDGEPVRFGPHTVVPVLFVEIEGSEAGRATAFVIRRSLRGGG
ncbi:MAG: hypothetical protein C0506_12895 [Anaerolinea sp.]|nr:hypothetical protein [Anaerolinea sp.]